MTQTKNIEAPASYAEQGSLKGLGDWTIEAIEGDNATLDATISVTGTKELAAAIAALQALMPKMAAAEAFRGEL